MSVNGINNKKMDVSRLQAGLHKTDLKKNDPKMESLFNAMDTDGDGVLNKEELQKFFSDENGGIDKNGDGQISRKEARKFLKAHKNDLKAMGLKKKDIIAMLNEVADTSQNIQSFEGNKEEGFTVKYKDSESSKTIDKNGNYTNYDGEGNSQTYDVNNTILSETIANKEERTTTTKTYVDGNKDVINEEVIKADDGTSTTTIKYEGTTPETNKPVSKEVVKGTTVENYSYDEKGKEVLDKKIVNKGLDGQETEIKYTYNEDGTHREVATNASKQTETISDFNNKGIKTTELTTDKLNNTVKKTDFYENGQKKTEKFNDNANNTKALTEFNESGNRTKQIKQDAQGKQYQVQYDGKGNTLVVLQNRESVQELAKKFGCSVEDIQQLSGKKKFTAGDVVTVKGEIEADDARISKRHTSEQAKAEHQRDVQIAKQREEARRRAELEKQNPQARAERLSKEQTEANKKLYNNGKKVDVGGQQLVVKGSRNDGHGRMIAVNANGEEIVFSPKAGSKDYSNAVILKNKDFLAASDYADKCAANGGKGLIKAASYSNVYYVRGEKGLYAFVMDKNGKIARSMNASEVLDRDAKLITQKLDKAAKDDDHWYSLGLGLGTDEKGIADANKLIKTPEQLKRVNDYYAKKYPNWKKDGYKSPYEAFLGTEISNKEIYQTVAVNVKQNAIKDQSRRNEIIDTNIRKYGDDRANMQAGLSAISTKADYEGAKESAKKYMEEHPDKKPAFKGQSDLNAMIYNQSDKRASHVDAAYTTLMRADQDATENDGEGFLTTEEIKDMHAEKGALYVMEGNAAKAIDHTNNEILAAIDEKLNNVEDESIQSKLPKDANGSVLGGVAEEDNTVKSRLIYNDYIESTPEDRLKLAFKICTGKQYRGCWTDAAGLVRTNEERDQLKAMLEAHWKKRGTPAVYLEQNKRMFDDTFNKDAIIRSEETKLSQEEIEENYAMLGPYAELLEASRANIKQTLAKEGAIDDMLNALREKSIGLGMTREDLEVALRRADRQMDKLAYAAEGKLLDKHGNPVKFENLLAQQLGLSSQDLEGLSVDEKQDVLLNAMFSGNGTANIDQGLEDYQSAQETGKDLALDLVITIGTMGAGGVVLNGAKWAAKGVSAGYKAYKGMQVAKLVKTGETTMAAARAVNNTNKVVKTVNTATKAVSKVGTKVTNGATKTLEATGLSAERSAAVVSKAKSIAGQTVRIADAGGSAAVLVGAKDYYNAATSEEGVSMERMSEIEKKTIDNALINTLSMGAGLGIGNATAALSKNAAKISESMLKYLSERGVDVAKNSKNIAKILEETTKGSAVAVDFGGQVASDYILTDVVLDHEMNLEETGMSIGGYIFGQLMARGHVHAPEANSTKPQGATTLDNATSHGKKTTGGKFSDDNFKKVKEEVRDEIRSGATPERTAEIYKEADLHQAVNRKQGRELEHTVEKEAGFETHNKKRTATTENGEKVVEKINQNVERTSDVILAEKDAGALAPHDAATLEDNLVNNLNTKEEIEQFKQQLKERVGVDGNGNMFKYEVQGKDHAADLITKADKKLKQLADFDEILKAIPETGGMGDLTAIKSFISKPSTTADQLDALIKKMESNPALKKFGGTKKLIADMKTKSEVLKTKAKAEADAKAKAEADAKAKAEADAKAKAEADAKAKADVAPKEEPSVAPKEKSEPAQKYSQDSNGHVLPENYNKMSQEELVAEYQKLRDYEAEGTGNILNPEAAKNEFTPVEMNSHDMSTQKAQIRDILDKKFGVDRNGRPKSTSANKSTSTEGNKAANEVAQHFADVSDDDLIASYNKVNKEWQKLRNSGNSSTAMQSMRERRNAYIKEIRRRGIKVEDDGFGYIQKQETTKPSQTQQVNRSSQGDDITRTRMVRNTSDVVQNPNVRCSKQIQETFSQNTQSILSTLPNQRSVILHKGDMVYVAKNNNGEVVITDVMNKNELCREIGNGGKELPDNYVANSLQVRQHLNVAMDGGAYTASVDSYKHTIETAHKLAYFGAEGNSFYYEKNGKLLRMNAGETHNYEFLRNNYEDKALDVEKIARALGDNYSTSTSSKVQLAGISDDALPTNNGTQHVYPGAHSHDQYFVQMHRTAVEAQNMLKQGIHTPAEQTKFLQKLAEHYQYAANVRPFEQINNSLFMNEVNTMLAKAGMPTMPHGMLDHAAQRLQPNNFEDYFIGEFNRTTGSQVPLPDREVEKKSFFRRIFG